MAISKSDKRKNPLLFGDVRILRQNTVERQSQTWQDAEPALRLLSWHLVCHSIAVNIFPARPTSLRDRVTFLERSRSRFIPTSISILSRDRLPRPATRLLAVSDAPFHGQTG